MEFEIQNETWTILEKPQEEFNKWNNSYDGVGHYYGQTHFADKEIWLWEECSINTKIKTLRHELMHVYIKEFITNEDLSYTEEMLCDICANAFPFVDKVSSKYYGKKDRVCNGK